MTDPIQPLIPLPFVFNTSQRVTRDISQTLTQFLNNLIYNSTTPLSFELTRTIFIQPLLFVNIMTLIYTILTPILLLQILKNPHFLFPLLLSQLALIPFEKTFILTIFISQLLMFLQPLSIIFKKKITFYPNMFSTILPYKTFSIRNLFLIFLILNSFALLKIVPTIGLPPIFFKLIIFNTNSFRIFSSIQIQKNKSRYTLSSFENSLDIITNSFGTRNSKMPV